MLKNILNLKGAQELSKNDQKSINGGAPCWAPVCGLTGADWVDWVVSETECYTFLYDIWCNGKCYVCR